MRQNKSIGIFLLIIIIIIFFPRPIDLQGLTIKHANLSSGTEIVPRIFHFTWIDDDIPKQWKSTYDECRNRYNTPDWKIMFWTDLKARTFIAENYPLFLRVYDSYPFNIQRADAIRYFVLYHFGGIYMDLDVGCSKLLIDPLLTWPAIIPKTKPVGFSNDVLISIPKHPFYAYIIDQLPKWNHNFIFPYLTIFFSTGPMFLTNRFFEKKWSPSVYILDSYLYSEGDEKIFKHLPGSSWHSWDGTLVTTIWNYLTITNIILILIIMTLIIQMKRMMLVLKKATVLSSFHGPLKSPKQSFSLRNSLMNSRQC
jgi:mannosyltransferase OCH1-like enzyme